MRNLTPASVVQCLQKCDDTPAFIYDEAQLVQSARTIRALCEPRNIGLLYSLKPMSFGDVLGTLGDYVAGFAASSLYEATLARSLAPGDATVHTVAPVFRASDIAGIVEASDYVSFNSLTQWRRHADIARNHTQCGIRINPHMSVVEDSRYDPCRQSSKLGMPLLSFRDHLESGELKEISGLHFHTNCDSKSIAPLRATVDRVVEALDALIGRLSWMNLGGGYLLDEIEAGALDSIASTIRSRGNLQLFIEPGAAFVRKAGYLVSTVQDIFESDGKTVAILDLSINHAPEVFEYQFEPDVIGAVDEGSHSVVLAGCSCLAGDVFGEYEFDAPVTVGSRVVFEDMGAYTMSKWHMFNGINLPSVYALTESGDLVLKKRFTYEDFASRNGVQSNAFV